MIPLVAKNQIVARLLARAQAGLKSDLTLQPGYRVLSPIVEPEDTEEAIGRDLLEKGHWQNKFSVQYAETKVAGILHQIRSQRTVTEEAITAALQPIIDEMESYSQVQEVYIPLIGVTMQQERLELGAITLVNMNSGEYTKLVERITAVVATTLPVEGREAAIEFEQNQLAKRIKGQVCACYTVVAESEHAIELAEIEAQQVVDLLRFTIPFLYSPHSKIRIGLIGEVNQADIRGTAVIAADNQASHIQSKVIGTPFTLELTSDHLEQMKALGVFDVAKLLKKSTHGIFENLLLAGIHMFANAQNEVKIEYELLNLITCLEIFFTQEGGAPIRATVADGVAFVAGSNLEERKTIKKKINNFYQKRSSFSHSGGTDITIKELVELYSIVSNLLVKLIVRIKPGANSFSSKKDLTRWIEDQKFR